MARLLPLLRGQREVARCPEGPVGVKLTERGLRQDGPVLDPGHREVFWIEAVQVAGQRES